MPLEWRKCFDPSPGVTHHEEVLCDRVGYRETCRIHSLLRDHGFDLYTLVSTSDHVSLPSNFTPLFQIQLLTGEILSSGIAFRAVYDTIMHHVNVRYRSAQAEVEPPNRKRGRETRFSNL